MRDHSRCSSENLLAPNGTSEGQEGRGQVWDGLEDAQDLPEGCPAQVCKSKHVLFDLLGSLGSQSDYRLLEKVEEVW